MADSSDKFSSLDMRSASDRKMLLSAINRDWDVPEIVRRQATQELNSILETDASLSDRDALSISKLLLAMGWQDQRSVLLNGGLQPKQRSNVRLNQRRRTR